jgi:DNA-binding NarL/FixJ family response regulator
MISSEVSTAREMTHSAEAPRVRVLLCAASPVLRARVERLLRPEKGIQIVASVAKLSDVTSPGSRSKADVLLIHGAGSELKSLANLNFPVVLLAEENGLDVLYEALARGVRGVVLSLASSAELALALRATAAGLLVFSAEASDLLAHSLAASVRTRAAAAASPHSDLSEGIIESLTVREHEVLEMMMEGLSNKEIAMQLNVSTHTVKFHISSILAKLGAASRTEAITVGLRRGLITI